MCNSIPIEFDSELPVEPIQTHYGNEYSINILFHLGLMAGNIDAGAQYPAFESVYRWTDGGALTFTQW